MKEISSDDQASEEEEEMLKKRRSKVRPSDFVLIENERKEEKSDNMILLDLEDKKQYFQEQYNYNLSDSSKLLLTLENIEIRNHDLIRLAPNTFINDTMMNFFIKVITSHVYTREASRNIHIFNTYFWLALEDQIIKINQTAKNRWTMQNALSSCYSAIIGKVVSSH